MIGLVVVLCIICVISWIVIVHLYKEKSWTETQVKDVADQIENTLEELSAKKDKIQRRIEELQDNLDGLVRECWSKIDENNELKRQIEAKEAAKLEIGREIARLNDECVKLEEVCANKREVLEELAATEQVLRVNQVKRGDGEWCKLKFSDVERLEIAELNGIVNRMKVWGGTKSMVLLKAIYDIYYAEKIKKLASIAEVNGVSGIYRLWVVEDGVERSYIGQSTDVGKRWTEHLKRAVGLDETATAIQLYPAMRERLEEFSWELVEACEKDRLSEREKYWGKFYAAKETGFNIKLG